ncbi:transcription factor bHLH112 isoform X2 [Arachis ipaensis]|uniref:transcription factor bHLH112 isoform X2 n=1 Tax=Arachis ipaensis TaxID=130454 RepID=UPI0007AF09BC|nr:transcription factor bHLH112 isoform X2 [Arachis ipaensis]XP_025634656.1 transcription factor bHLH112 isoform X2 [Arachis hypogaea]
MADDEDFQGAAGICGENWWRSIDSTRSVFPPLTSSSSPCSVAPPTDTRTWPSSDDHHHCFMDLKAPACDIISNNNNNNYHMGFHDAQEKPHNNKTSTNESQSGSILIDSTFQMMGFGLSSPNWDHQSLLENNNWSRKNFGTQQQEVSSTMDVFKRMNNQEFSSSTLIQTLYDPQRSSSSSSLFTNRSMSYSSSSTVNYHHASDEVSLSPITWPKLSSSSSSSSSSLSLLPPMAKHPDNNNIGLHFSNNNNTPFWNASSDAFPFEEDNKPNSPIILLNKLKSEELCLESVKKNNNVCSSPPPFKRPRIETPPPLPTFKVRKEKLGDRVTALQQLVSPFGKTDTASVLHEAIEYIKFLHDQVSVCFEYSIYEEWSFHSTQSGM